MIEYVRHMSDEAQYILRVTTGKTAEQLRGDETLKRAVVRSLEIMGEAAKQLSDDYRLEHADIPWKAICGMRDRLIHGYITVDYDIVWQVAVKQMPEINEKLTRLLTGSQA